MNPTTETMIDQMLEPVFRTLPADVALRIVNLEIDQSLQEKVEALAQKANEGLLTEEELSDYESIVSAGDMMAFFQALARRSLEQPRL